MSKLKSCCPVCGENDWSVPYDKKNVGGENREWYNCNNCCTEIHITNITRRVMDWVPVTERLPENKYDNKSGEIANYYWCRVVSKTSSERKQCMSVLFFDGVFFTRDYDVVEWFEDKTLDNKG